MTVSRDCDCDILNFVHVDMTFVGNLQIGTNKKTKKPKFNTTYEICSTARNTSDTSMDANDIRTCDKNAYIDVNKSTTNEVRLTIRALTTLC